MATLEISIIIVNWNSKDYVEKCVASVMEHTRDVQYEIIVVDSGSFDGCADLLARQYPQVRFVQSQENIGFGRANNLGASVAQADYLLLLNPDAELVAPAVKELYDSFKRLPNAGIVGCRLLNTDRSLQITCVQSFPTIWNQVLDTEVLQRWFPRGGPWLSAATFAGAVSPQSVEVMVGACMFVKKSVFDGVGGFSDEFFMYAEDADLCFKTRAFGLTNYYLPNIEVVHHGGGSTKRSYSNFSSVMMRESIHRLIRKLHGDTYGRVYRVAIGITAAGRLMLLGVYAPVALLLGTTGVLSVSVRKWAAILRWSLGLETWVQKYDTPKVSDSGRLEHRV